MMLAYLRALGPRSARTYLRWRLSAIIDSVRPRSYGIDDETLLHSLETAGPAHQGLGLDAAVDSILHRETPRFRFSRDDQEAILRLVAGDARQRTLDIADDVVRGVFAFRGYGPVEMGRQIDWLHTPDGNIDWRWDLNRHGYFETLGRAYWYSGSNRYVERIVGLVGDWLGANPPSTRSMNWSSIFEVAIRVNTWTAAFFYMRDSPAFDGLGAKLFLRGLLAHARALDSRLELHVPNNHLLLEAKALAMVGVLFPEFSEAPRWRARGLRTLLAELGLQVGSDGVHLERSTHYHRIVTGELLELAIVLERNGLPVPAALRDALQRMVEFELWIVRPDGSLPLLGDSSENEGDVRFRPSSAGPIWLGRSDLLDLATPPGESDLWLLGPSLTGRSNPKLGPARRAASRLFPIGGYAVLNKGDEENEASIVFDCGPFGYERLPMHGHADALSFELYAAGRPWMLDPGAYSMHFGVAWRNYFRGTHAHNTVVVDGEDQSILVGTRRVHRPANVTLHRWATNETWDIVQASHDGFGRLRDPILHRRCLVLARAPYCLILDELFGFGSHRYEVLYHLPSDVEVLVDEVGRAALARDRDGRQLTMRALGDAGWLVDVCTGESDPIQGWMAIQSGKRTPAPVVRFRLSAEAPVRAITFIGPPFMETDSIEAWSETDRSDRVASVGRLTIRVNGEGFSDVLTFGHAQDVEKGGDTGPTLLDFARYDRAGARVATLRDWRPPLPAGER